MQYIATPLFRFDEGFFYRNWFAKVTCLWFSLWTVLGSGWIESTVIVKLLHFWMRFLGKGEHKNQQTLWFYRSQAEDDSLSGHLHMTAYFDQVTFDLCLHLHIWLPPTRSPSPVILVHSLPSPLQPACLGIIRPLPTQGSARITAMPGSGYFWKWNKQDSISVSHDHTLACCTS